MNTSTAWAVTSKWVTILSEYEKVKTGQSALFSTVNDLCEAHLIHRKDIFTCNTIAEIALRAGYSTSRTMSVLEFYLVVIYIDIDFITAYANQTLHNGRHMKTTLNIFVCTFAIQIIGCSTLVLRPVDFSWPIEVTLQPDGKGNVREARYQLNFNVKALLFEELQDSTTVTKHTLHLLRDQAGYYFITAKGFKNVYVFEHGDGTLKLEKKILVSEKGLDAPAFNQRVPFVSLINENRGSEAPILLTKDGIAEGGKR
jgi:hypothetical protein